MPSAATALRQPPPNDGGTGSEQGALELLVERLVRALDPVRIILFGSRAEGCARPNSDFDLLVLLSDDTPEERVTYEDAYAPVLGLGIGCDVVPCLMSDYQDVMAAPTNPWRETWSRGRTLYGRL